MRPGVSWRRMGKKSPLFQLSPIVISPSEEGKKKAFQMEKPAMQAEFYAGYKTTLLLTLHLRITIRFFLHNVTSLPNPESLFLYKNHTAVQ